MPSDAPWTSKEIRSTTRVPASMWHCRPKKMPGPKARQVEQGGFTSGRRRIPKDPFRALRPELICGTPAKLTVLRDGTTTWGQAPCCAATTRTKISILRCSAIREKYSVAMRSQHSFVRRGAGAPLPAQRGIGSALELAPGQPAASARARIRGIKGPLRTGSLPPAARGNRGTPGSAWNCAAPPDRRNRRRSAAPGSAGAPAPGRRRPGP